ncbi:hypothetical protein LI058_14970 [Clostridium perfringens]|uniref:Uncharacterized protein n=6 Tax=Clostridium perfringens TaxID=1502 RepID=A0AAV3FFS4_CLOPF|nr:hypothetical protein [Clostridium perfringens]AQW26402.1 hypothetical protein BXT94_06375 [Clostridium perfringens]ATD48990.1 hypothetical protein CMR01_09425 [Clostridium perfringens]EHK2426078.1 hypothetical protein [Clostridium perfringens]EIA17793.1 hypothetical protein HA1_05662 [Clostridium perfringens F262]ELC8366839.1 hypothetical protein [Clostridium perfringens]
MVSVTQRIKQIKQPRGGYIRPKEFNITILDDNIKLNEKENIHSSLVGLAVDYMTRYSIGTPINEAFKISIMGASIIGESKFAQKLIEEIEGLDDNSIVNACKLVGYDVCCRAGIIGYKPVQNINPDKDTIDNIRYMIKRSLKFIEIYGPIIKDGFTFEGGYTNLVSKGDGDFLTKSTLWDFKVSTKNPTNAHTLQLLMYYLMGINSTNEKYFKDVEKLGIFNPRLNSVYLLEIKKISSEIIKEISEKVIGY